MTISPETSDPCTRNGILHWKKGKTISPSPLVTSHRMSLVRHFSHKIHRGINLSLPSWSIHLLWYILLKGLPWTIALSTRDDKLPPETWELAKNETEIESLRVKFGGIIVDREATPAAFLPGWPEAAYAVLLAMIGSMCGFQAAEGRRLHRPREESVQLMNHNSTQYTNWDDEEQQRQQNGIWTRPRRGTHIDSTERDWFHGPLTTIQIIITCFISIAWTVSFVLTELYRDTADWNSVVAWGFPPWIGLQMMKRNYISGYFILLFTLFQWSASLTTLIQRWQGKIWSIVYIITNSHSCIPHSTSFVYLTTGIRA